MTHAPCPITHHSMLENSKAFGGYSVTDLQQAKKFYGELLGLSIAEKAHILGLNIPGGSKIIIYEKPDHTPATFTVLNFPVDDIEKTVDELTAKGIQFEQYGPPIQTDAKGISRSEMASIAWFKDPAGNILSVLESGEAI